MMLVHLLIPHGDGEEHSGLPEQYPGTVLVPLEQNYRSTQKILDVTNKVIAEATERHAKELWSSRGEGAAPVLLTCSDEDAQTTWVVDQIARTPRERHCPQEAVCPVPAHWHHSMALEAELGRGNVPFVKYGGLRFLETADVREICCRFCGWRRIRWIRSQALRVLVLLPGIGQAKAASLIDSLREAGGHFESWLSWTPRRRSRTNGRS